MTDDASVKAKGDPKMPDETIRNDLCVTSQNLSKCSSFTIDSLLSNDKRPQLQAVEHANFNFQSAAEKFDGSCDNVIGRLNKSTTDGTETAVNHSRCPKETKLEASVLRRNNQMDSELYQRSYSDGKYASSI